MSTRPLRIATFNIHKGVAGFGTGLLLHGQRELLRRLHADIVFLQEVRGAHEIHRRFFARWPEQSQHEFLADSVWQSAAYGKNAVYPAGHHGNAILSKYPITYQENLDISAHPAEQRGMLHCCIEIPGWERELHCICVHLGLLARWRRGQLDTLRERIVSLMPPQAPLIIAGDFNDWHVRAGRVLAEGMHLREVFEQTRGRPARSFPSIWPFLRLDRIYTRGFRVQQAEVHGGPAFARFSDHAALSVTLHRL